MTTSVSVKHLGPDHNDIKVEAFDPATGKANPHPVAVVSAGKESPPFYLYDNQAVRIIEGGRSLPPHLQRVRDERYELGDRIRKLADFMATATFDGLNDAEKSRLRRQNEVMCEYSSILNERISAFVP